MSFQSFNLCGWLPSVTSVENKKEDKSAVALFS